MPAINCHLHFILLGESILFKFIPMNKLSICLFILVFIGFACQQKPSDMTVSLEKGWKFTTGDSMAYASPAFNDSSWKSILPSQPWERQGYADYDGFAWYRIHFFLPSDLKKKAYFKDSIQIVLDKIDDTEETYLNGKLLGQNGTAIHENGDNAAKTFTGVPNAYSFVRRYVISANDSRLLWDKENVIAVRVDDTGGDGGMYGRQHFVSMIDVKDMLKLDIQSTPLKLGENKKMSKGVILVNTSSRETFSGNVKVEVKDLENQQILYSTKKKMEVSPDGKAIFDFEFMADQSHRNLINYSFTDKKSGRIITAEEELPYILTPRAGDIPRINGARVYGQRPGHPFLFLIPATGKEPLTYAAENLPEGLSLDVKTGIISGAVKKAGTYIIHLSVSNEKGKDSRDLKIVIGKDLALTPPLGWNSWNCWGLSVDAEKVKAAADNMLSTGLARHGWSFINIDDGWEAPKRAANGEIVPNEKFPDMNNVTGYVHSKGMKMGIYSSPGPLTCGGYLGTYQHEQQDAKTWAKWGLDYIKYDWCSYSHIAKNNSLEELKKPYIIMHDALSKVDRDIVFSLCQYGMGEVWKWGAEVGGNLWRTTGDITDSWESMSGIGFNQTLNTQFAGPGHWNDPDMLVVGWVGWGPSLHPSRLTASEQYTHISLWALLSAPMLIGCDLTRLDDFTLNLLCNDEVLDIDQDPLGKQAAPVDKTETYQVWKKQMEDGSLAIGLFNTGNTESVVGIDFSKLGISGKHAIRDCWRQKDLGEFENHFEGKVPSHGVLLVRIR